MKEYIERAALKRELAPYEENDFSQQINVILAIVDAQPTADVVEVVRCGECRHAEDSLVLWCTEHEQAVSRLDFCSHGARMDKEADHEVSE